MPVTTPTTVAQMADAVLARIRASVDAGHVPPGAASFSELHDYVDANAYLDGVVPDPDGTHENLVLQDAVCDAVDARLPLALSADERYRLRALAHRAMRGEVRPGPDERALLARADLAHLARLDTLNGDHAVELRRRARTCAVHRPTTR